MSRGPDHTAVSNPSIATPASATDGSLVRRLRSKLEGNVLFDDFSRGRYSTDASIYQIRPLGVAVPRTQADVHAAIAIAHEMGVPVLPRGGGTSQNGQTVNEALVIDISKYLNSLVSLDIEQRIAGSSPGWCSIISINILRPRADVSGRRLDQRPSHTRACCRFALSH